MKAEDTRVSLSSPDDAEDGQGQNHGPCCAANQSSHDASVHVQFFTPPTSGVGRLAGHAPEQHISLLQNNISRVTALNYIRNIKMTICGFYLCRNLMMSSKLQQVTASSINS